MSILRAVLLRLTFNIFSKTFNIEFFEHHELERVWTFTPFLLLIFIVLPRITVLYKLDSCLFCGVCLNITGHQWYWRYNLNRIERTNFDSYILPMGDTFLRLIDVDNRVRLPTGIPVRFIATSADVIHSWTVPSFGIKIDAIPGRVNQICLSGKRSGIFFGQCSEICGANHRFIPIVVEIHPYEKISINLLVLILN